MKNKKAGIIILDGWGIGPKYNGNAFLNAKTPVINELLEKCSKTEIETSGEFVGLPKGQMGNSEVGHMNIGTGREILQSFTRISKVIKEKKLAENDVIRETMEKALNENKALHLMGLVSKGGVHSHIDHLVGLVEMAKELKLEKVYIHAILDGRDVDPKSGSNDIKYLLEKLKEIGVGKLATVTGRYYTMDRDQRWERIKVGYDALVNGIGDKTNDFVSSIEKYYNQDITDEFMPSIVIDSNEKMSIGSCDSVIFFNFRPDRARQITKVITENEFNPFDSKKQYKGKFVCFTEYDNSLKNVEVAFKKENYKNTIGEYLSSLGKTQLRIAETEKYAHVTFFFNGGVEEEYKNEERILIPSPKVETYDLKPEMSANEVKEAFIDYVEKHEPDFFVLNFANPDMVGHTGILSAAIKAMETVDKCLGDIVELLDKKNYQYIITADHGNLEEMYDQKTKKAITSHTTNPVYAIIKTVEPILDIKKGSLKDLAPTILEMMSIDKPREMTGKSLIKI